MLYAKKSTITKGAKSVGSQSKEDHHYECECRIVSVLAGEELEFIKNLFKMVERKAPKGELLGLIDSEQKLKPYGCHFMYSWGEGYYCAREKYVEKF